MATTERRYPLGTDDVEHERLLLQHRLWSDAAHALWRLAKIAPGSSVLDIGCGPGAASFDLSQVVTSSGRVFAVDESQNFVDFVNAEARARGLNQLVAVVGDVQDLAAVAPQESGLFDAAYARWVLCFISKPAEVVRQVAQRLKPGGVLCVHDYFNYHVMTPAPRRPSYTKVVQATAQSWRDNGGDPDVVAQLPGLLHDAGMVLEHLTVHQRRARPGDTMWYWASTWWKSYTPKLVANGYVTADDERAFHADLGQMTVERDFLVLPPVFEVMARKK